MKRNVIAHGVWMVALLVLLSIPHCTNGNNNIPYVIPEKDKLNVNIGVASFRPRSKGIGGELVLNINDNKALILTCAPPGSEQDPACYSRRNPDGSWTSLEKEMTGAKVEVLWAADPTRFNGRVYQVSLVGEKQLISYIDSSTYYKQFAK